MKIKSSLLLPVIAAALCGCSSGASSSIEYPDRAPELSVSQVGSTYVAVASLTLKMGAKRVRDCIVDFGFYAYGTEEIGTVTDDSGSSAPIYNTVRVAFAEIESGPLAPYEEWYCVGSAALAEKPIRASVARIEYKYE